MSDNKPNSLQKADPKPIPAWKQTILAAMTNYIDAGSIVAGAAGLSLWEEYLHLNNVHLGLLAAFSSNAISAAIGALIGGKICDKFGRKFVYMYDLLIYMIGMSLIVFAVNFPMLFIGYIIVGLSVGAGVTASWTLIAEQAPAKDRAKHCGMAQVAWALGPAVVLVLSVLLGKYGLLGNRIVFAHLILVALITWLLRFRMPESEDWKEAREREKKLREEGTLVKITWRTFLHGINFRTILFLTSVYAIWNLAAGTVGFFMPYIYEKIGGITNSLSNFLMAGYFIITALATCFIFMALGDRVNRRLLYGLLGFLGVLAWVLLTAASAMNCISVGVLVGFIILFGINNGSCQQPFYQLWCSELFPTRYRAFAQGITFFTARIILGIWNICFTWINQVGGFTTAASFMVGFTLFSMLAGTIFAPNTSGKTLKEIEKERYGSEQ
ncbi:MAG: MFS transporter [Planctomycetia bacterium]|nr:MFS transporter [Planctomycetia bacterium]